MKKEENKNTTLTGETGKFYTPEFGEIVRVEIEGAEGIRNHMIAIYPDTVEFCQKNNFFNIATVNMSGKLSYNAGSNNITEIRPASEDEKKELIELLKEDGKRWDSEKKELVEIND